MSKASGELKKNGEACPGRDEGLSHLAVTIVSILTCRAFLMVARIADRFSIVGLPEAESIRWRLLLGL